MTDAMRAETATLDRAGRRGTPTPTGARATAGGPR